MPQAQSTQRYTYQDYLTWNDDERWELIDGVPYNMTPAPINKHQIVSRNLFSILFPSAQKHGFEALYVPVDVVFSEDCVVQPDIVVVNDPSVAEKPNIQTVPELVVEILSPRTSKKDRTVKRNLYERFAVKEYLLVDLDDETIEIYRLNEDGKYGKSDIYVNKDEIELNTLPKVKIPMAKVFQMK